MIKLSQIQLGTRGTVIRVDGRLSVETVGEFQRLIEANPVTESVTLELSGLASVDAAGIELLHRMRKLGFRLSGESLYIKRLLEEISHGK